MHEKFKSWLADDIMYVAFLLILVGIGSFGLGRLSVMGEGMSQDPGSPRVILLATSTNIVPATSTFPSVNAAVITGKAVPEKVISGPYVGSKSGTKYYLTECSGAKRIKVTNKVFFATKADAAAAGYEPAANCPGL